MQVHTYHYIPCQSHYELDRLKVDLQADTFSNAKCRARELWQANEARADFAILRDFAGYLIWSSPSTDQGGPP